MNDNLQPVVTDCENKEKDLIKQFRQSESSDFNYDKCCVIFRHLIEQVEKENKVKISYFQFKFMFLFVFRNEKNV